MQYCYHNCLLVSVSLIGSPPINILLFQFFRSQTSSLTIILIFSLIEDLKVNAIRKLKIILVPIHFLRYFKKN